MKIPSIRGGPGGRGLDAAEVGGGANFMLRGLNNLDRLIGYVIINYEKNTRFSAILNFT